MRIALALCLALAVTLAVASPAAAQYDLPEPGDLGIFFDPGTLSIETQVPPFLPFDFHLVAFGPGEMTAWEAGFNQPAGLIITGRQYSEGEALEVGVVGNHIVWLGGCRDYGGPVTLLRVEALLTIQAEFVLCLMPADPSSFDPPTAGWLDCAQPPVLHEFGVAMNGGGIYPNGCAVVNPFGDYVGVPVEQRSFGGLKAGGR